MVNEHSNPLIEILPGGRGSVGMINCNGVRTRTRSHACAHTHTHTHTRVLYPPPIGDVKKKIEDKFTSPFNTNNHFGKYEFKLFINLFVRYDQKRRFTKCRLEYVTDY